MGLHRAPSVRFRTDGLRGAGPHLAKYLIPLSFVQRLLGATLTGMSAVMDRAIERPTWGRGRVLLAAGVAALVLAAGAVGVASLNSAAAGARISAKGVTLGTVERGVFHDFVVLRATAQPKD